MIPPHLLLPVLRAEREREARLAARYVPGIPSGPRHPAREPVMRPPDDDQPATAVRDTPLVPGVTAIRGAVSP